MVFAAPKDAENVVDLECFTNGAHNVLAVELDEEERKEFLETGKIFVSVLSGPSFFPIFVGSETSVRELIKQDGREPWPSQRDLLQRKILREVHKLLGADLKRREACRKDPQKLNVAAVEVRRLLFNTVKLGEVKAIVTEYLDAIKP